MNENLKSDEESKNEAIHTESAKLDFKRNSENNNEVRRDSNGDEILYEIWHNPNWWDYFLMSVLFMIGAFVLYSGIEDFLLNKIDKSLFITMLAFGIPITLMEFYYLFYTHKNRFYITTQGIGFERRRWFRMQKGFYRFGEVGVVANSTSLGMYPGTPPGLIGIFPLGAVKSKFFLIWQLKPHATIALVAWDYYLSQKIYLHDFLVKKTKEALEAKGIDTNTLYYDLGKQFDLYHI